MYLSKVSLAPAISASTQLGLMLKDQVYGTHRLLHDLFEHQERYLFREEFRRGKSGKVNAAPVYYLLSQTAPSRQSAIFEVSTKLFDPQLDTGDILDFRLRANPTIAKQGGANAKSKRHDVIMNAQLEWLKRELSDYGLDTSGSKGLLKRRLTSQLKSDNAASIIDLALLEQTGSAAISWLSKKSEACGFSFAREHIETSAYRWNALPEKGRSAGFSSLD
ncbi:MAG: type I-E CRISPR-associated protein Cas6/Cse3/CasE, partial [Cellvibrionaceae bacterium]|nr:type I-E CRISPR-associated protein Cas6/Cse3/CasE [Cellvibrionaceae bacterium]